MERFPTKVSFEDSDSNTTRIDIRGLSAVPISIERAITMLCMTHNMPCIAKITHSICLNFSFDKNQLIQDDGEQKFDTSHTKTHFKGLLSPRYYAKRVQIHIAFTVSRSYTFALDKVEFSNCHPTIDATTGLPLPWKGKSATL